MIVIYGYQKCSTVKKALKFLKDHHLEYTHIDNVENKLTADELKEIHEKSGLEIKKLYNTSGIKYRELQLKDKVPTLSLQENYELLATDGLLVKRPILIVNENVLIGFKEGKYEELLLN